MTVLQIVALAVLLIAVGLVLDERASRKARRRMQDDLAKRRKGER